MNQEIQDAQVIFVSHSGGKDSQAMLAHLVSLGLKEKLVVVHADLGDMEWEPMHQFIEDNAFGLPVHVVRSELDFFSLSRKYGRLPSGQQQFCTDFLKTKPIAAFIHDYMTRNGLTRAINATGMRAEESPRRAKKSSFSLSKGPGTSNMYQPKKHPTHIIHDWLPIFEMTTSQVLQTIYSAGQATHEVYSLGFSRLSCVFCVNGRIEEHKKAAKLKPELFSKVAQLEKDLGKAYRLKQVNGQKVPKYLTEYC